MKKIFVFGLMLLGFSNLSMAYSTCANQNISKVFNDGHHTYIGIGDNSLSGVIPSTKSEYQTMISIVLSAKMSNAKVEVRYKNDGVNCNNPAWNEEISGVGLM